jgi:hypothetical protein
MRALPGSGVMIVGLAAKRRPAAGDDGVGHNAGGDETTTAVEWAQTVNRGGKHGDRATYQAFPLFRNCTTTLAFSLAPKSG